MNEKEKEEFIEYMTSNEELEVSIDAFKKGKIDIVAFAEEIAKADKLNKGLILGVETKDNPYQEGELVLFSEGEHYNLAKVQNNNQEECVLVFSSKEELAKCENLAGVVMFIENLFGALEVKKEIDGLVFNLGSKGYFILNKMHIRAISGVIAACKDKGETE